ncbi:MULTISPECIES: AI-2E family transporter [Roseobacteraceae]|jgi:predicted PurR-regulated permease PerM|uniref:AI-2E family transporter n=1 Tax=Roseobacteraceae TaxID=2854170 RepID=UPI001CFA63CC|nr:MULTISPECIES: AI-2E family transporter [Roseobacteraceae]|tara:strand:- start:3896 stop:5002 length:1107 start_codon:yes stop_codon:yes gene_type:complete
MTAKNSNAKWFTDGRQSEMSRISAQHLSFLAVVILVTAAFVWLILPFYGAILWASILAILFAPLHRRLQTALGDRRNAAAALSVLICICIVVIPGLVLLAALAQEASNLYVRINTRELNIGGLVTSIETALPPFMREALSALNLGSLSDIQTRLTSFLLQVSQVIATRAVTIGQSAAQLITSLGVMLYLLFFLFRDGASLTARIRQASPLSPDHTDRIFENFSSVMKATVKGNAIIAAIQGAIGGLTFWALGIDAPVLWGVLMGAVSLLPAVGAPLVWLPAAGYLLITGDYLRGIVMLGAGGLIISMIDNLLRPPLVGKGTRLPDYVILISTLGGIVLIGMNGFVLGPLIAALFVAVWQLFGEDRSQS